MPGFHSSSLLPHLVELERRDESLARELDAVGGLLRRVDEVRGRAAIIREALAAIPPELAHIEEAERQAREHEAAARDDAVAAERRAAEIEGGRRRSFEHGDQARRELQNAREALNDAEARVARLVARRADVLAEDGRLRADARSQAMDARELAATIRTTPRVSDSGREEPGGELGEIEEWGARAHAALFVVRGVLEAERERIVTEAGTIGTSILGENVGGSTVSAVRQRLEER